MVGEAARRGGVVLGSDADADALLGDRHRLRRRARTARSPSRCCRRRWRAARHLSLAARPCRPVQIEIEPEVEHRGRVRQRADRDAVRARRGVGADGGERHAARHLGQDRARARPGAPRRWPRTTGPGVHVVEQHGVGPGAGRLGHLVERRRTRSPPSAPATASRARPTASVMLVPARWLSLTRTASDSPARWLVAAAGAHRRLLEGAQAGGGLAGVEDLDRRVALVRGGDERAVRVAMPDRWPRKFSAVRSAVRIGRSGPVTSMTVSPADSSLPSADVPHERRGRGRPRRKASVRARPARPARRRARARSAKCAIAVGAARAPR